MHDKPDARAPLEGSAPPEDELERELYAALRAAGASSEEALSCLNAGEAVPPSQ